MLYEEMTKWRKLRGLSLDELATKSNVPLSTLRKVMSGNTPNPQIETVQAIADALDCTLDDFVPNKKHNDFSYDELNIIYQYRNVDQYGKEAIKSIANIEFERCKNTHSQDE